MRILIFLSTSCLIYYGNAAGNSNQIELASADDTDLGKATVRQNRDVVGGETEQDPNDSKYQKMARELVLNHLRIQEEAKNIKVNRVTTQVVAGIITRIEIKITLVSGNSDTCNFQVWERSWENVKHVTFKCSIQKQVLSGISSKPRPEQTRDPKDPKYQKLAKASIDYLFQTAGNKPFKKDDISKVTVTNVKVNIGSKIMNYIQFNVNTVNNNNNYKCSSRILEIPWNPQETAKVSEVNCELAKGNNKLLLSASPSKLNLPGGQVDEDPDDPKYQILAKISFLRYLDSHRDVNVHVKSIKIDSVTSQVVAGTNIRMHFHVYPTRGNRFECQAKMFETLSGHYSDFNVSCNINIGGEEVHDPDDPEYQQLAKESFQFYLKTHKENVQVKRIKVDYVTTQVVAGKITRIHFRVYPTRGSRLDCQSKIFEKLGPGRNLEFDASCSGITGGEEVQDPDDPQYQRLAKKSFEFYLKTHKENVHVKRIKVDSVTTQVVAGVITRIHFRVYPTRGSRLDCQSKIFEKLGRGRNLDFDASCSGIMGGEEVQDPDDPQYQQLAKKCFEFYLKTYKENVQVKRIKVDSVTTQVVAGKITRIHFRVYPTRGSSLDCQSKIFEKLGPGRNLEFDASCSGITGGEEVQDPDDPQYQQLAKKSFEFYLKTHKENVHVKRIKVDSVTTQVVAGVITRIHFRVYPTRGSRLDCQSKIFEKLGSGRNLEFDASCSGIMGGEEVQDPDDPQYQQLAKKSFEFYLKTYKENVQVKKIKIDSVTTQVVAGKITRIHFRVYPARGSSLDCQSKIFEKLGPGRNLEFDASCSGVTGGEEVQDPDDPQYQQLAKKSFEFYLKTHKENVHVKRIKVDSVTTQVVAGTITRIHFRVYPTRGSSLDCQSKIFEKLGPGRNLEFDASCSGVTGGEEEQDPDDPQYQQLAIESLQFYLKTHKENVHVKRIKVDSVTRQVVAGTITRIHFRVYPTRGSRLDCQSKVFEKLGRGRNLEFDVKCNRILRIAGGEEEQDPDGPQYEQLANESFRKYRETHIGPLFAIKEQKVTRATTQVVAGLITRLEFYVTTTEGGKYTCHSEIYEQRWKKNKKIVVYCSFAAPGGKAKLALKLNSNSKRENFASKAVKQYLEDEYENLYLKVARSETRSIQILTTRVSKQKITYYKVDAFARVPHGDNSMFNCSVLAGSWFGNKPFATNCIKVNYLMGRSVWVNPTNKKYLSFAEKSLQLYLKDSLKNVGPRDYRKYDVIVTFVKRGLAAGYVNYMNFVARWVHGNGDDPMTVLKCNTEIWEKLDGKTDISKAKCEIVSWNIIS